MGEERARILKMVAEGKISVSEADELLEALQDKHDNQRKGTDMETAAVKNPKYMYVKVTGDNADNVDIRIPFGLLRAGMRFTSLIPPLAMQHINKTMQEKGISFDMNNFKPDDVEELIKNLADMEVNVNSKNGENVRVYCA